MQLVGDWQDVVHAVPLAPFDSGVLAFLDDLSKELVNTRLYSDVATFGFWCRRASLQTRKAAYDDLDLRIGKGIVFHSTPSNVPVNFAFSFAAGLLAGNANIVRLPGKEYPQVTMIVDAVKALLADKHKDLAPYICFVRYPPDKAMHDQFSAVCDVRVIWGGDNTIKELRQSPLKPRATELTFADRYSVAVIHADRYLEAADKQGIAQSFYNDTYLSDQNACTAPRVVFWLGNDKAAAKALFWDRLRVLAREKYTLSPVQAVGKWTAFYMAAAHRPVAWVDTEDWYVTRVNVQEADEGLMQFKYNSGFYFESDIENLKDILPICGERLQTLIYYGLAKNELAAFFKAYKPKGIDRAVPMGSSMAFTLVWDGYDLIRCLSRSVLIT